jgi:hypothetical protein
MDIVVNNASRQAHLAQPGHVCVGARRRGLTVLGGEVSREATTRTAVTAVDGLFPTIWTMGDPAWSPPT